MRKSTLTMLAAAFALFVGSLVPETAWAQKKRSAKPSCNPLMDIGCAASPVAYRHRVPGVRSSSNRQGQQRVNAQAFFTKTCIQRHSYEHCMARWGTYCDTRGDDAALFGTLVRFAAGVATGGVSVAADKAVPIFGLIEREGTKAENRCHYWRTAFMTKFERERSLKDNEAFLARQRKDLEEFAAEVRAGQITTEGIEAIIYQASTETADELRKVLEELAARAQQPLQAPAPVPATPPAKEKDSVPSAEVPTEPSPKAAAPKAEEVPAASPSKDEPKEELPLPSFVPAPDMANDVSRRQDPNVAFNPATNR